MRTFALFAAAAAMIFLTTADGRADGTWCAQYGRDGGTNCGFYSYEQCRATVSGTGGYCYRNPFRSRR